jgi:quinoprotein glucose dehydrogenase
MDWPMYVHDAGATRYSPLTQINTGNVSKLTQAWTFNTKPTPESAPRDARTTPLVINGVMYFVTGFLSVVAVEPETGKQLWSFEHKGIAYWPGNKNSPPTLFFGTDDGFLIALNAKTGKPVPGFANEGELELRKGMKDNYPNATYGLNGSAIVYKNLGITGSHVQDNGIWAEGGTCGHGTHPPGNWCGRSIPFLSRAKPATRPGSMTAGKTARE